jgi:hypothetical protein
MLRNSADDGPPLPPRPVSGQVGLQDMWKSYRQKVEINVAEKLGGPSAGVLDVATSGKQPDTFIRAQMSALRKSTRYQDVDSASATRFGNTPTRNVRQTTTKLPPSSDSPNVSSTRVEKLNEEITDLRNLIAQKDQHIKTLENVAVVDAQPEAGMVNKVDYNNLLSELSVLKSDSLKREVELQRQLTHALTEAQRRAQEIESIRFQFDNYKSDHDKELASTLTQAEQTISDLELRLKKKKKTIRKYDVELKRLRISEEELQRTAPDAQKMELEATVAQLRSRIGDLQAEQANSNSVAVGESHVASRTVTFEEELMELKRLRAENSSLRAENSSLRADLNEKVDEIELTLDIEDKMNKLHREHAALKRQLELKEEECINLQNILKIPNDNSTSSFADNSTEELQCLRSNLAELSQKLAYKIEECEELKSDFEKTKTRRETLDEIVKSTKASLYDVQDQLEQSKLELKRSVEAKQAALNTLEDKEAELEFAMNSVRDRETDVESQMEVVNARVGEADAKTKMAEERCENLEVQLRNCQVELKVAADREAVLEKNYAKTESVLQKTIETSDDYKKQLERFKALLETADTKNREKATLYQSLMDEKEKLEERCDKMQNHLSRGGTEAEINMARNEARDLKEELAQRKKEWGFQDEENKKKIDSLLKKVSDLEIEDKINKQEIKKEKEIIKKLKMQTKELTQSQESGLGDENPSYEDFDNDSGTEEDDTHRGLARDSGSGSERKPRSTHVHEERGSRAQNAADMESFFSIEDDDLDETGAFGGAGNGKQSTKDALQKSGGSCWDDDTDEEGDLEDKRTDTQTTENSIDEASIASAANINTSLNNDVSSKSCSDGESSEESEEEESDGDSEEESEEEKHGWEKMEHNNKIYYWNWDTEETVWERPTEYASPAEETSEDDAPTDEEDHSETGPVAKKEEGFVESNEKEIQQNFLKKLEAGIPIKKFPNSSGVFSSGAQARTIWLNTSNNVLYWQKGTKDPKKVKLESSVRMKDIMTVSLGIKSDVLRRHGTSKNSDLYLSLQCASGTRNLDIEAKDREQRNYLASGFNLLLKDR